MTAQNVGWTLTGGPTVWLNCGLGSQLSTHTYKRKACRKNGGLFLFSSYELPLEINRESTRPPNGRSLSTAETPALDYAFAFGSVHSSNSATRWKSVSDWQPRRPMRTVTSEMVPVPEHVDYRSSGLREPPLKMADVAHPWIPLSDRSAHDTKHNERLLPGSWLKY